MEFNKIFFRPPQSTYVKKDFSGKDRFFEVPTNNITSKNPPTMKIPCLMMPFMVGNDMISKYYIVYFHGNAEDLGTSYDFLFDLRQTVRCNIILTEYAGYGIYRDVSPNCQQIEYDAKKIFEYLTKTLEIPKQHIILLGRSMGSGPACLLASQYNPRGLMLISAFTSLRQVAKNMVGHLCGIVSDRFRNIECAESIRCPVLLIHGKKDQLVPFQHSQQISDKLQFEVLECFQDEMTHNEYDTDADIMNNIATFLKEKMNIFQKTNDPLFSKFENFHQKKFLPVYPEAIKQETTVMNTLTEPQQVVDGNPPDNELLQSVEIPSLVTEERPLIELAERNNVVSDSQIKEQQQQQQEQAPSTLPSSEIRNIITNSTVLNN